MLTLDVENGIHWPKDTGTKWPARSETKLRAIYNPD